MIYTLTLNPAIDLVMQLEALKTGCTNRASGAFCLAGGKGVNVSQVLRELGRDSVLTGFAAGFTGEELVRQLREKGCNCDFVMLEKGFTRINVKLHAGEETEINSQGDEITDDEKSRLLRKLSALGNGDILVLAGSIPKGLGKGIYSEIMAGLSERGVLFIVDTEGQALLDTLEHRPFLIKPNNHELGAIFGCTVDTAEKSAEYGFKLQEMGARNVLVSMAGAGAVLCAENGEVYFQPAAKGTVVNSVGAGDSMVAGFLAGWLDSGDYQTALHTGTAAGAATAFSQELARAEDIERIMSRLEAAVRLR